MAGDWIKFEHTTPDKPEVVQMSTALRMDQDAVVGKLLRVWVWADQNSVSGKASGVTDAFIDRLTGKRGFAAAMRVSGWLTGPSDEITFTNFDRNNGASAKARAMENRKKASQRERAKCPENVPPTSGQTEGPKPGPEKRREEKSITILPSPPAPADPRHYEICQQWGAAFTKAFRIDYRFDVKDATTLKRFLKGSNDSASEFLSVASKAWDRSRNSAFAKRCKEAATIHGLCTFYNEIRVELQTQTATPDKSVAGFAR